jgi:hypothetical protein
MDEQLNVTDALSAYIAGEDAGRFASSSGGKGQEPIFLDTIGAIVSGFIS